MIHSLIHLFIYSTRMNFFRGYCMWATSLGTRDAIANKSKPTISRILNLKTERQKTKKETTCQRMYTSKIMPMKLVQKLNVTFSVGPCQMGCLIMSKHLNVVCYVDKINRWSFDLFYFGHQMHTHFAGSAL